MGHAEGEEIKAQRGPACAAASLPAARGPPNTPCVMYLAASSCRGGVFCGGGDTHRLRIYIGEDRLALLLARNQDAYEDAHGKQRDCQDNPNGNSSDLPIGEAVGALGRRVQVRERQVELHKPKLEARDARVCDGRLLLRGQRQEDGLVMQRSEHFGVHGLARSLVHDVRHAARAARAADLGDEVFDLHALHVFDGRSVRLLAAPSPREAMCHVPELRGRVVRRAPRLRERNVPPCVVVHSIVVHGVRVVVRLVSMSDIISAVPNPPFGIGNVVAVPSVVRGLVHRHRLDLNTFGVEGGNDPRGDHPVVRNVAIVQEPQGPRDVSRCDRRRLGGGEGRGRGKRLEAAAVRHARIEHRVRGCFLGELAIVDVLAGRCEHAHDHLPQINGVQSPTAVEDNHPRV
mmetsp:Transcript_11537/g.28815  ORF Transcript_11537/g.28815 Transcript_11537/m.28815 type:complete len:402 (+) Transcript_11537:111-1316(+)